MSTVKRTIGEQAVARTFGDDKALVGMFNDTKRGQKAGYYVAPRAVESELQTAAHFYNMDSRCYAVAREAFPSRIPLYSQLPYIPGLRHDATKATACVLYPTAHFDTERPAAPAGQTFKYDTEEAHFTPIDIDSVDGSDQSLWTLQEVYAQAENDLQVALRAHPTPAARARGLLPNGDVYADLDIVFGKYEVARRNFEAALQYREYLVSRDEMPFSPFLGDVQAFAATHNMDTLFSEFAPQTKADPSQSPEVRAMHCKDHYKEMQKFINTRGRYCSPEVQEKLLGGAVFALVDALKEAPTAAQEFKKDTRAYLDFQRVVRQYSHPMSNQEFRKRLVAFLFNKSEEVPSEAFRRAVAHNPAQRKKLDEMAEVKYEAIAAAKRNLLKRGVRAVFIASYDLYNAIGSMLSDRRFMGVEEIVRRALKKSDGWIPSRPFEDFLPDDDAELEELTKLRGCQPSEVEARTVALKQVAYRTRMHAEQAFEKICHGPLTLDACLKHAAQDADFESSSAYFNTAKDSLEMDVYGRLQRLGEMDHAHPGTRKHLPFTKEPARSIYKEYSGVQDAVAERLHPAMEHLYDQLNTLSDERPVSPGGTHFNDRYASLPNDIEWLQHSFPALEITPPGREATQYEHAGMSKVNALKPKVRALAEKVQTTINTSRHAKPITTTALRAATFAPTTAEIRTLLAAIDSLPERRVVLPTAPSNVQNEAQSFYRDVKNLIGDTRKELANIVHMAPSKRAVHMKAVYERFDTLNTLMVAGINNDAAVQAANAALEAAERAIVKLQDDIL